MSHPAHDLRAALVRRLLDGDGQAPREDRQAAFEARAAEPAVDALLQRVATRAWTVQDEHVAAAVGTGQSQDQVFELVVCAAVGQATRQLEAALAVLEEVAPAAPKETHA